MIKANSILEFIKPFSRNYENKALTLVISQSLLYLTSVIPFPGLTLSYLFLSRKHMVCMEFMNEELFDDVAFFATHFQSAKYINYMRYGYNCSTNLIV